MAEKIGAAAALAQLDGWMAADGRDAIVKSFRFADFNAAFAYDAGALLARISTTTEGPKSKTASSAAATTTRRVPSWTCAAKFMDAAARSLN